MDSNLQSIIQKTFENKMLLKNTHLFALAILLTIVSAHNLAFDLRSVKYSQASDFWTVEIPCTGGSGQYSYEFDLPSGWKNQGNKIQIPSSSTTQTNSQYAIRCRVKDSSKGDVLERSLVFKPFYQGSSYSLEVTDHEYFYGNSNLKSNSQESNPIHGIDVLNRLGFLVQNAGSLNFGAANMGFSNNGGYYGSGYTGNYAGNGASATGNAAGSGSGSGTGYLSLSGSQSSTSSSQSYSSQLESSSSLKGSQSYSSSTASYYSSLPSISQLEKYIVGGDIVEIIQIIQLVVDSKIRCDVKACYLSDFFGRISAAIEVKKYTLSQLKTVVTTAVTQVQKLTVQIQTIKGQQSELKIDEFKKQMETLVAMLKASYDEYNNFNVNCSSYESEMVIMQKQMNKINIKYNEVQQQLDGLRKTNQSIDVQIAEYELRIKKLKEKKASIQDGIVQGETFIQQKDIRIKEINDKVTIIKTKTTAVSTQKDSLKQAYTELQKKVEATKGVYQSANEKFAQLQQQIVSTTVEIERYQKQTSELQFKQVNQCVQNLDSAVQEIKESIDFVQYNCFNAGDIEIAPDSKSCYHFSQSQWTGYVNQCYSNLAEQIRNKIAQSFQNQVIQISTINIFSDVWKQNYGSCFEKNISSKAKNYKTEKNFGFESDFSCSSEFSNVETKSGIIQGINSTSVSVKGDDGKDYNLRLGSCSRFQGKGKDFIPRKGQNILWKGSKQSASYNMHSCTCY